MRDIPATSSASQYAARPTAAASNARRTASSEAGTQGNNAIQSAAIIAASRAGTMPLRVTVRNPSQGGR